MAHWRVLFILLCLCTARARAQEAGNRVVVSGDLVYRSAYLWRGLVRANRPIVQADAYGIVHLPDVGGELVRIHAVEATGGVWTAWQLGGVGEDRFGDLRHGGLEEWNPWVQVAGIAGDLALGLGVTSYFYRGDPSLPLARTDAFNTTELFGQLGVPGDLVSGRVTGWWDVDRVRGLYLESGVTLNLPLIPIPLPLPGVRVDPTFGNLFVAAVAGWSAGQGEAPGQRANFEGNGLTHLAFSLSSSLVIGTISVDPALHLRIGRDRRTKLLSPVRAGAQEVWFSLAVRPLRLAGFGRVER